MPKGTRIEVSRRTLGYALASVLFATQGGTALAAEDSASAPAADGKGGAKADADQTSQSASGQGRVEEIVVLAQKRQENLQDVPIAISAVTSATLAKSGVGDSVLDLAQVTPGLQTTQVVSGFSPRIRGIGSTDSTPGNENAVSVYVDGVYIPGTANGLVSLSNIERVEVLKGPQGTLFGRNTTGGVIQIITKKPSFEPGGNLSFSYSNYDTKVLDGYLTTGLGKKVAIDFAGRWEEQSGYWGTNVFDGSGAYRRKNYSFRSKLLFDLSEATQITIAADYYNYKNEVAPFRRQVPSGFYDYATDLNSLMDGETWGVSGRLEQDFGPVRLVSISAYRHLKQSTSLDIDLSPAFFQHAFFSSDGESFSQEVQLLSPTGSKLKWILGGFYFYRTAEFAPGAQEGAVLSLVVPPLDRFEIYNKQKTTSYAMFAQATYPILENANLTAGIRYTNDKQNFSGYNQLYPTGGIPPVIVTPTVYNTLKADKVTYRIALDYHFTPEVMVYLSYNTGFKSGFFNISGFPAGSAQPEFLKAFEGGVKAELFDKHLRLNVSAYHYDYDNVQSIYILQGQAVAINAGSAKLDGVELESTLVPVDNWNIRFGFNWMPKARYEKFAPCPGPQNPPFVFPPGSAVYDCSGSRMINAPKWDLTAGTDYTFPTSIGEFNLALSYHYTSRFPWDADFGVVPGYNTGLFTEPGHSLVNVQGKWTSNNGRFSITVWSKNLGDVKYLVNGNQSSGSGKIGMPGAPRTYGVTVGAKF